MKDMTDAILAVPVLAAMAALAVHDARRALVDPRMVLLLVAAAAAWRFGGSAGEEQGAWAQLAGGVLGAALGVAAVAVPIAVASWRGKRWPLYPGDAMLLGALGFLLGVPGLAWTMLLGSGLALVHRFWLQRRRGRPFRKGLVPLAPGMCAGAAVVFLCLSFGVALADTRAGDEKAADSAPAAAPLPATELGPVGAALPAALAAREITLGGGEALPFPALLRRLSALAGLAVRIEERPARVAGGGAVPDDPPPLDLAWQGPLAGLLDRIAARSGYDWSWETRAAGTLGPETLGPETLGPEHGAVLFYRYWDTEQRAPAPADAATEEGIEGSGGPWTADPAAHETLRGVLEAWAAHAGWTLVWNAGRDWRVGAGAVFEGGFLEAADLLLSGPLTRRTLDVRAYAANRHLVVDDAGGGDW